MLEFATPILNGLVSCSAPHTYRQCPEMVLSFLLGTEYYNTESIVRVLKSGSEMGVYRNITQ